MEIAGGCACGAVRYEAAEPILMMNCHCLDCQKATGSAFSPSVVVPKDSVRMQGGLRFYEKLGGSGKTVRRGFCADCGSPVAGEVAAMPLVMIFYAASLDDPSIYRPTMDVFTASAHPWDHMSPDTQKKPYGPGGRDANRT